ncbi:MAG: FKBP-type peptidyl-prolyl cis-trans isomerase [Bdellovibrionota bacterium]
MKILLTALISILAIAPAAARADDDVAATPPAKTAPAKTKKKAAKAKEEKVADKSATAKPLKVTKDDGLVIEDLKVGTGMEAKEGSRVRVHYKGTFMNGKEFDSNTSESLEKISPFTLDAGHLIAGWVEGIPGMKVGGKRKLKVPFKLAYGEAGTPDGSIPPRADLNFEVELLQVE